MARSQHHAGMHMVPRKRSGGFTNCPQYDMFPKGTFNISWCVEQARTMKTSGHSYQEYHDAMEVLIKADGGTVIPEIGLDHIWKYYTR